MSRNFIFSFRLGLDKDQSRNLKNVTCSDENIKKRICLPKPKCDKSSKYRSIDGSCNSNSIPNLGQTFTPFRRVAQPNYADGNY